MHQQNLQKIKFFAENRQNKIAAVLNTPRTPQKKILHDKSNFPFLTVKFLTIVQFSKNSNFYFEVVLDAKRHQKSKYFYIFIFFKISAFSGYIHCWVFS